MKAGILYAIGTGPGASDLLTVRAARVLGKIDIILAPYSPKNDYSICLEIVREFLPAQVRIERLAFPMTKDRDVLTQAWNKAAITTCSLLDAGAKCAFLTLGDPLFYSTFIYLVSSVLKLRPETDLQIIPGITSCQAATARIHRDMGKGNEVLRIIPGTVSIEELKRELENDGPAIILKAYRNLLLIKKVLDECGRLDEAMLVSFVENPQEKTGKLKDWPCGKIPPYMSLVLCPATKRRIPQVS